VGDREFMEKCLNSVSKNTSKHIFPHGTKSLMTSVIRKEFRIFIWIIYRG